ncbi:MULTISPECIES: monovalent cation:proton antiporter-2 (CPA2) family protein [Methylibium]|uniref:Kef-type K+ transport n=1 Tax=Methylibium petroleiphilum (strain ATCC BAA-1232 / LMG 22953 / PM1) TaxID=420662 RepID=A2SBY5_METPP|nr:MULTISPECIES: monovalent cation:proton antiporter-2 (CPA2) family protein [Methylibium]ABM93074.1 Kef-type K+ transport [Methylibium petroleiphilum PM1]EWS52890.1 K(+)/H(+) antiporter [Methylibium sp. T29]EWS57699.1 K(+)/H(+) antiporter [Methylibium sp. T29-B]
MAVEAAGNEQLVRVVVLLAAGVVAVPLFKRLGLGSVLGYLAAGLAIGPFGLGLFVDAQTILHVAELGVVMFLFVIGLEMQPKRLWSLRREIFGLGLAQVVACGALLTGVGMLAGLSAPVAFVAAMGFVMTSTATVMLILDERGETATSRGQRVVSILLLEDLAIVPLLAIVAFLAPAHADVDSSIWRALLLALVAVGSVTIAGRWLLNPMFRLLAAARAREVMTAAALLVVLGAALLMQFGGLSMAMGAFLAGVMLSESSFRHQLEADIEPFRGILLGLFFLSVGMSLDLTVFASHWPQVLGGVVVFMLVKAAGIYVVARALGAPHGDALHRMVLMAQGGEFAFVLYSAGVSAGLLDGPMNAVLTAIVILSMALTPLAVGALRWMLPRGAASLEGVDRADGLTGSVLMIGFGRFGQVASQALLARGVDVAIIDSDTEMIQSADGFGFKVYYGDGTRLDVLHASGAATAEAIAVCVDDKAAALKIVELVKHSFPQARLLVRSFDREHALKLIAAGVDYQVRETFESASAFGEAALRALGATPDEAAQVAAEVRRRDDERLQLQITGGLRAGVGMMLSNRMKPTPLTKPARAGLALNEETASVTANAP